MIFVPQRLQCITDSHICAINYKLRCLQTRWNTPLQLLHHKHDRTTPDAAQFPLAAAFQVL